MNSSMVPQPILADSRDLSGARIGRWIGIWGSVNKGPILAVTLKDAFEQFGVYCGNLPDLLYKE